MEKKLKIFAGEIQEFRIKTWTLSNACVALIGEKL